LNRRRACGRTGERHPTILEAAVRRSAVVRALVGLIALLALVGPLGLLAPQPAAAQPPFPARIDLPDGFRPEGITTGRGTTIYVGSLATGSIWRGDVRTGDGEVFIQRQRGVAVGLDYEHRHDRLWVAGGPTGVVRAYDARTGALLAEYAARGGFLNDLVVTRHAVYVTDSMQQHLVVVRLGRGGALPAEADILPLTGDISFVPGEFNANGIVAARGGRVLILVQSNERLLFRVNPLTGEALKIDLGGATLGGDGLELRGRTLYVVRGRPDLPNSVSVVRLGERLRSGRVVATLTDSLDVPSTATLAAGHLWVVNARFGTPSPETADYWITRLPRR
jgi:hypothetical protein